MLMLKIKMSYFWYEVKYIKTAIKEINECNIN